MKNSSRLLADELNKLTIKGLPTSPESKVNRKTVSNFKEQPKPKDWSKELGGRPDFGGQPQASQSQAAPAASGNFAWANNLMNQVPTLPAQAEQAAYEQWVKNEQAAYEEWKKGVEANQAALIAIEQDRAAKEEKKRQDDFWRKSGLAAFRDMGYMKPDAYKDTNLVFHEANISGSNGLYNAAKGRGNNIMFARNK